MNDNFIPILMSLESSEDFTLARKLDLGYTTNKILIILLLLVFLFTFGWNIYSGKSIIQSVLPSFLQMLFVFFCWAFGREIDPFHDYAAFFGIPLLFLPITFGYGNVFILLWFLIGIRLINQTPGKPSTNMDVVFFVFLSIFSALLTSALLILPLAILIIILTSFLPKKQPGLSFLSIPLIPSFFLLFFIKPEAWVFLDISPFILVYIAISSGLLFLVTTTTEKKQVSKDPSLLHLSVKRVQTAQLVTVISLLSIITFHGGILFVFPLWASITGVGIHRLISLIVK
jgi:hypothetical protein